MEGSSGCRRLQTSERCNVWFRLIHMCRRSVERVHLVRGGDSSLRLFLFEKAFIVFDSRQIVWYTRARQQWPSSFRFSMLFVR